MKIAIVGVTGLVGGVLLKVLEERNFAKEDLIFVASSRSVGKEIHFANRLYQIISIEEALAKAPDFVLFSAGSAISLSYAPIFADGGSTVIDNSSAGRSYDQIPLVIPEVNADTILSTHRIIANPNCSTIQVALALAPLHQVFRIKRLVISTYQSVTGTGIKAVQQLDEERSGTEGEKVYPHPIDLNLIPHGGAFDTTGYTSEERKLVDETKKILQDQSIQITATVVRVPVKGGHSASINVEFENDFELLDIYQLLGRNSGIKIVDNPHQNEYPTPLMVEGKDDVLVGRIRKDESQSKSLNLFVVADNLRKGAATNAVQIMEYIIKQRNIQ